jgi:intracellular septation protein A
MLAARDLVRKNASAILTEGLVNVVLPFVVYSYLKPKLGDVNALLASMVPPLAWSAIEFVRKRRIDAVSVFIVIGIALSLLAFVGGGSVRFLQLRENLVTGLIGVVFLLSAAIGKPLIYQLARAGMQRKSAAEAASFERLSDNVYFRRSMSVMTLVWGIGLIVQTAVACVLVFMMSIKAYLVVSPILGYGTMGALALWTFWYGERQKRLGAASRASAENAPLPEPISNGAGVVRRSG